MQNDNHDNKFTAIVLSAGSGTRMKSDIPKQYMMLKGHPVIYYSLKAFQESPVESIVLVVGKADVDYVQTQIVDKYNFTKVKAIVPGGSERYESVYNGLMAAAGCDYIMIHDGARPLISQQIISNCMENVIKEKACVTGMPVKDTIKMADTNQYAIDTPARDKLWMIQTPQCFLYSLIVEAYDTLYADMKAGKSVPSITDDAMVVEYGKGYKIKLIEGSYSNLKITTPEDIDIASILLKND